VTRNHEAEFISGIDCCAFYSLENPSEGDLYWNTMEPHKIASAGKQRLTFQQLRQQRTVRTGNLTGPFQITEDQERELFRRTSRGRQKDCRLKDA
jgi:hypothetical protein